MVFWQPSSVINCCIMLSIVIVFLFESNKFLFLHQPMSPVTGHSIPISKSLKLLGVTLDAHLTFSEHVNNTCRAAFYHLRTLRHIGSSLADEMAQTVACAVVRSRLDYCNSLYVGMSDSNFVKLRRVRNSLARIVTFTRKHDHITSVLNRLHWLPVRERVIYKTAMLTYKSLNIGQPEHLSVLLSDCTPSRQLLSLIHI